VEGGKRNRSACAGTMRSPQIRSISFDEDGVVVMVVRMRTWALHGIGLGMQVHVVMAVVDTVTKY
jgi:hypothetical protein